jgi:hypothetical protein
MTHTLEERCCDFCKSGRTTKQSLRIAFQEDTDLGNISCLACIPVAVCTHCGAKNWTREAETITEDSVRREYVKLLSARRRSAEPYPDHVKLRSSYWRPSPYPIRRLEMVRWN